MSIVPSNETVVRFIAVPGAEPGPPHSHFVIGFGFGKHGGKNHRELAELYGLHKIEGLYAGYLEMEHGKVRLNSGGNTSLNIVPNAALDDAVNKTLQWRTTFSHSLANLFPLVTAGSVMHVMLSTAS